MYIYTYTHVCIYIHMYIYIYICICIYMRTIQTHFTLCLREREGGHQKPTKQNTVKPLYVLTDHLHRLIDLFGSQLIAHTISFL